MILEVSFNYLDMICSNVTSQTLYVTLVVVSMLNQCPTMSLFFGVGVGYVAFRFSRQGSVASRTLNSDCLPLPLLLHRGLNLRYQGRAKQPIHGWGTPLTLAGGSLEFEASLVHKLSFRIAMRQDYTENPHLQTKQKKGWGVT